MSFFMAARTPSTHVLLLSGSLILSYQGLEEENLDQKSPGPPGWGLVQWASSSLITKKQKNAKKPNTKPRKADRDRRPKLRNRTLKFGTCNIQTKKSIAQDVTGRHWARTKLKVPISCRACVIQNNWNGAYIWLSYRPDNPAIYHLVEKWSIRAVSECRFVNILRT